MRSKNREEDQGAGPEWRRGIGGLEEERNWGDEAMSEGGKMEGRAGYLATDPCGPAVEPVHQKRLLGERELPNLVRHCGLQKIPRFLELVHEQWWRSHVVDSIAGPTRGPTYAQTLLIGGSDF